MGERHQSTHVPEPALLAILHDLINGCQVLQTGGFDTSADEAEEKWTPIIHRDLKLPNIFFGARTPSSTTLGASDFPSYPRALLGDFGIAIMSDPDEDAHSPFAYSHLGEGTPRWLAPEQVLFRSRKTLLPSETHNWKLSEKTKVWGIGAIMIRLMSRGNEGNGPQYKHGEEEVPMFKNGADVVFSVELRQMALSCCAFNPDDRPSLQDLRGMVDDMTVGSSADEGLRRRNFEDEEERARLGLVFKEVPAGFAIGAPQEHEED